MKRSGKRIFPNLTGFPLFSGILASIASLLAASHANASIPRTDDVLKLGRKMPVRIRVKLADANRRSLVRGYDLRFYEGGAARMVGDPDPARSLAASIDRASQWEILCQGGRVQARRLTGPVKTLELRSPVTIETPAGFLRFQNRPYREALMIHARPSGCMVVNELDVESYLDGLVNSEFSAQWNEESIAAQVVAARTYAIYQIRQARLSSSDFDVSATVHDQVYDGSMREHYRASRNVDRTRGLVLTTGSEKKPLPLKAFYHSTCGGRTELPEHVWGSHLAGFKRTVQCPFCATSPRYRWNAELTAGEIAQAIRDGLSREKRRGSLPDGELKDLKAVNGAEGRLELVKTYWLKSPGTPQVELAIPAPKFRDWMGSTRIRSTAFQVAVTGGAAARFRFEGRGNGHGVGLCQWGAKVMGERGHSMASILHFYYPDAIIRKLW